MRRVPPGSLPAAVQTHKSVCKGLQGSFSLLLTSMSCSGLLGCTVKRAFTNRLPCPSPACALHTCSACTLCMHALGTAKRYTCCFKWVVRYPFQQGTRRETLKRCTLSIRLRLGACLLPVRRVKGAGRTKPLDSRKG